MGGRHCRDLGGLLHGVGPGCMGGWRIHGAYCSSSPRVASCALRTISRCSTAAHARTVHSLAPGPPPHTSPPLFLSVVRSPWASSNPSLLGSCVDGVTTTTTLQGRGGPLPHAQEFGGATRSHLLSGCPSWSVRACCHGWRTRRTPFRCQPSLVSTWPPAQLSSLSKGSRGALPPVCSSARRKPVREMAVKAFPSDRRSGCRRGHKVSLKDVRARHQ